jgi:AbiV family abortive infection protein
MESSTPMTLEELKKIRELTLKNAESLLDAAKRLAGEEHAHIRYHLSTLALEEVGKADLFGMQHAAGTVDRSTEWVDRQLEDHVKKLFWAIWGPSFASERVTGEQIELYKNLASGIHKKRLYYLYSDPEIPVLPQDKVDPGEVERLVALTEARIGLARAHDVGEVDASRAEKLKWFAEATEDPEKREGIFGGKSMQKLAELGDVKEWISWLQEVYRVHDEEMRKLVERELRRTRGGEDIEGDKPKWRLRIRIYSHSHSIRQKPLNAWNDAADFIKLTATGKRVYSKNKKDEVICDLILSEKVPIDALWHHGWGLSRIFVTALNIGTRGFFWWYVPQDTERFYEEIWDLEENAGVRAQPAKRLQLAWGNLALDGNDLNHTALVFGYVARIRGQKAEEPLNKYITGLTFFSKIDWHFRFEVNAFEEFWEAFKLALQVNDDWDGVSDLKEAAGQQMRELLSETENLNEYIDLGINLDKAKTERGGFPEITLTEVIGMKLYCDLYFLLLARRFMKKAIATEKAEDISKS